MELTEKQRLPCNISILNDYMHLRDRCAALSGRHRGGRGWDRREGGQRRLGGRVGVPYGHPPPSATAYG